MLNWITLSLLIVLVCAKPSDDHENEEISTCPTKKCSGEGYQCIDGACYCASGYVANPFLSRCVRCPGLKEKCFEPCCNTFGNGTLTCWQGTCRYCYDDFDNWICRDSFDQILLISSTQIAMATALVLGIIATFMLLYKLCAATTLRPMGSGSRGESRLSIGSLQVYVEERLRDAPPRYSNTAPSTATAIIPATVYINAGFIHDASIPPPPYTPQKEEDNQIIQNTAVHI